MADDHVHVQLVANSFFPGIEGEHLRFFDEKSVLIPPAGRVREFTDPPEDDGAANPEDEATAPPEQVEGTLEEVPVFTACLKSGCSIICLTRLSKLLAVEESRAFAMFQYGAKRSMEHHGAC